MDQYAETAPRNFCQILKESDMQEGELKKISSTSYPEIFSSGPESSILWI